MNRKFSIAAMIGLCSLATAACDKKKKDDPAASAATGAMVTGNPANPAGGMVADALAKRSEATGLWSHMPAETEMIVGVNVDKVLSSSLWKQYGASAAAAQKKLSEVKEKCGLDITTELKSVLVGFNSDKDDEPTVIVRGMKRSLASKCITAMAESEGEKVEVSEDGVFTVVKSTKENKTQTIGWIDDSTMLMVPEKNDKDYLLARIAGTDGVSGNAALLATVAKTKHTAPIWFAGKFRDGSNANKQINEVMEGKELVGVFGRLGFERGFEVNVGGEFTKESDAAEVKAKYEPMLQMGKGMLGEAGSIVDKVKLKTAGSDLTMNLELTMADLETLKKALAPMLGGFLGGR